MWEEGKTPKACCIICGGAFGIKRYEIKAVEAETGDETGIMDEWAHIECLYKLLEKAECKYGGRN